jgi:hypothetical protein
MWTHDRYRADGIYAPLPIPVIYPRRDSTRFASNVDTAPIYAWDDTNRGEAPFDILDYAMVDEPSNGATLRRYHGTIPINPHQVPNRT